MEYAAWPLVIESLSLSRGYTGLEMTFDVVSGNDLHTLEVFILCGKGPRIFSRR